MRKYEIELLDRVQAADGLMLAPNLSRSALIVAAALLRHLNRKTGRCDPGIKKLIATTGKSKSTILRALNELCSGDFPLIVRNVHGGSHNKNKYILYLDRMASYALEYDERAGISKPKQDKNRSQQVTPPKCQHVKLGTSQPMTPKPIEIPSRKNLDKKLPVQGLPSRQNGNGYNWPRKQRIGDKFDKIGNGETKNRKGVMMDQAEKRLIDDVQKTKIAAALYSLDEKEAGTWKYAVEREAKKHGMGIRYLEGKLGI